MTRDPDFSSASPKNGRYPRAYRLELVECITRLEVALELMGLSMTWVDALQKYRSGRRLPANPSPSQVAATFGVSGLLPSIVQEKARDLDKAFQRMHRYDPRDHVSRDLISLIQSRNASHRRPKSKGRREEKLNEIEKWLARNDYAHSSDKNDLVARAAAIFQCGDTDVRAAAKKAGLTRKYCKSSK
jgi:hypothetical protein